MIGIRKALLAFLVVVLVSAGATLTQAQRQTYRGTARSVRQLILRIENRTDTFRNSISAQNSSRVYGRSGDLNNLVNDLDSAVVQLRERFDQRQSTAADVQEVLNRAALIDRLITQRNFRGSTVVRSWTDLRTDLNQLASVYNLTWQSSVQTYPNDTNPPTGSTYGANQLTGTYRLDPANSDDPGLAADRATQSLTYGDRTRLRDQLAARLESPDQIAIELRGKSVTLASSRAPQITFSADGVERVETTNSGRTIRARATLNGDQLVVSSSGDRDTEFNVTFNPIDNGRRLSVTRRVYVSGVTRPVVVQSMYNKTSDVARFDINTGPQPYPNDTNNPSGTDFILTNGETVIAVLDNGISTANARVGDRFTATVRQPTEYEGATLEGHVSSVERSGRITGRSQMTLNFDTIRLREGRSYRFAGIIDSVRNGRGETVKIDNEGSVRDDSQTNKTVQRAAIGTAVGAIIGAIAGGGKGAAIGAIVGAGGGAGSVYVQGREDLELDRGTELVIRATGPR
ncbi:MAG TPA: YMGG-like glycine zipper-containing protein [Pyrinomonadaceae bacterium]|jgi:YMGG-like Gly-zipper